MAAVVYQMLSRPIALLAMPLVGITWAMLYAGSYAVYFGVPLELVGVGRAELLVACLAVFIVAAACFLVVFLSHASAVALARRFPSRSLKKRS
ncbi:MAG: hypothetical protein AAB152_16760 [Candidatus Coatesbacteria bacterium]